MDILLFFYVSLQNFTFFRCFGKKQNRFLRISTICDIPVQLALQFFQ